MCGIAGLILSSGAPPPEPAVLSRLIDTLAHRGPDGTGHAVVGRVALVHNRLSIIDLVTGDQPLFAGPATLVCNGEIYNYRELRVAMPGVNFATNSDCEPPLHLWLREGADYVQHLRGMYAIAMSWTGGACRLCRRAGPRTSTRTQHWRGSIARWRRASICTSAATCRMG